MRSRPDKIVKLPPFHTGWDDEVGNEIRPYGVFDLYIGTGGDVRKSMVYENRMAVVHTYLNKKEKMGGDPLRSTAVTLNLPTNTVERVLDCEIGRCPDSIRNKWEEAIYHGVNGNSREYTGFMRRQRKLDKEYGTAYAKTRPQAR